jgi:pyruvate/2-oxoglutarate dehydrogenase complex dihydrolipoamide acyltransferase (E2) component
MTTEEPGYKVVKFPKSRVATIDVCEIGKSKHHITALIEADVTASREKIRKYRRATGKISFTAWLIKVIAQTIKDHENVAALRKGKRRLVVFDEINISVLVEKEIDGQKVPLPVVISRANEQKTEAITAQLHEAISTVVTSKDVVLQTESNRFERFYHLFPGFARRYVWRFLLKKPKLVFRKMGNVAITSVGMAGNINGWFIPISVHPICFGIGSIIKKPKVVNDSVEIRQMLAMSVLMDHDVVDGAPMARFISELSANIETGKFL